MSGTIRVVKSSGFTTMSNYHLRDLRLSLKARGLLSTVLSLPDDWEYSVGGLAAICKESRDGIRTALNELMDIGYVERGEQDRIDGKFTAGDYTIYEVPPAESSQLHRVAVTGTVTPSRQQPHGEGEHIIKDEIKNTNSPISPQGEAQGEHKRKGEDDISLAAFMRMYPRLDNPDEVKEIWKACIDISDAKEIMAALKKQTICKGNSSQNDFPTATDYLKLMLWKGPVWKPGRFQSFWVYYPRGEAKGKAAKAWDKLQPDNELLATIARALKAQKESENWQAGVGIPYASTYLNQRRWEDEVRCNNAAGPVAPAATVQRPEVDAW